jgi:aspartate/methionine/tyrosine aminotransferase
MNTPVEVRKHASKRVGSFAESAIRGISVLAAQHKAVNIAQGVPDFPAPTELKDAACQAINQDINQYAPNWGDRLLRDELSAKNERCIGVRFDPQTEITVTCGATEGIYAAMLACIDPGDEVIVLEPFYENYLPNCMLLGAVPRYVALKPPDWTFDEEQLARAFNNKTKALLLNTPANPTGKVFNAKELAVIARLCQKWGVLVLSDETYEHIVYDGEHHIAIASLPGMRDLTVTIGSLAKTYSVTGWRLGTVLAAPEMTAAIRKVHDFLTIGAPAPLQRAAVTALKLPQSYYDNLLRDYAGLRDSMQEMLDACDIPYFKPQGAYYFFCNIGKYGFADDMEFARFLIEEVGVAVVPGSCFFAGPVKDYVRLCFAKKPQTIAAARERLLKLPEILARRERG